MKRRRPKTSVKRLNQAQLSVARSQALAREKQHAISSYEQMRAARLGSGDLGRQLPSSAPTSAAE